jgi:tetratricopeptide (TPR) repeat protein
MRTLFALVLLLACATPAAAQPGTDEQLAVQYFQQGEFGRALLYYEKLYRQQSTDHYYDQLLKCHMALQDFESAEKLVRDRMKRNGNDTRYPIDMGHVLKQAGQPEKAAKEFDRALKMMRTDAQSVRQTANAFQRVNELDLAIMAYEKGQKAMQEGQSYHYELANLYAMKGDVDRMVTAYMDLIATNEAYLQSVQNSLSRYMDFGTRDGRSEVLRTELLRRIQRDPQRTIFQEMLIWMYIQQRDLESAFVQSRAMDRRFEEGGVRLMDLARIALANGDHGTAFKCYDHVVSLNRNDANYIQARIGAVRTRFEQLTAMAEPARADLLDLDRRAVSTLSELGLNKSTIDLLRDRASLLAYYLDETPEAIALLEQGMAIPGLDNKTRAQLKLDLGDVHLLRGDIWEASLLYSQVDLDFKHDMLGHEARLRNAKVSYFAGDFLWAQAQLDVLKTGTSRLIANDAMELSLRITDNIGLDSNFTPLEIYARAELLTAQHRYDEALITLDSLDRSFPMHPIGDDVLFQRARIATLRGQYAQAVTYLEKIVELYPLDILVDNALLELGILHEERLNDKEKAMGFYEKLLFDQPGSIFVPDARARFRRLRGDGPLTPGTAPSTPQGQP